MYVLKILIVEEHSFIQDYIANMTEGGPEVKVVGRFDQSRDASFSIKKLNPDIILIDEKLTGFDVEDFARETALENTGVFILEMVGSGGGLSFFYVPFLGFGKGVVTTHCNDFSGFLNMVDCAHEAIEKDRKRVCNNFGGNKWLH